MKRFLTIGLGAIAVASALCSPSFAAVSHPGVAPKNVAAVQPTVVHVSMRASASVSADADGFFSLGSVADITGGAAAARARLASVNVGRAPFADSSRQITVGDIALKMRQAGLDPKHDAVIDGSPTTVVTLASGTAISPSAPIASNPGAHSAPNAISSPGAGAATAAAAVVKRGDAVSIVLQEDGLSIATSGVARDPGALGDEIRVHRDGGSVDLRAIILDAHTVQLEL